MRSDHRRLLCQGRVDRWPSAHGIYLAFLLPSPPAVASAGVILSAGQLRQPEIAQPDGSLLCDLVGHHPRHREPLLLTRADVGEVLAGLGQTWRDLGCHWEAIAASVASATLDQRIVLPHPYPLDIAFLGEAPHVVTEPDGSTRPLNRASREAWRSALTAELTRLLVDPT